VPGDFNYPDIAWSLNGLIRNVYESVNRVEQSQAFDLSIKIPENIFKDYNFQFVQHGRKNFLQYLRKLEI